MHFHSCIIYNSEDMGKLSVHQQMNGRRRWISLMTWEVKCQLCPPLCDPMDCSPPDSSVHGIFQARVLGWVALPFSKVSSQLRGWNQVSCIAGGLSQAEGEHKRRSTNPIWSQRQHASRKREPWSWDLKAEVSRLTNGERNGQGRGKIVCKGTEN